MILYHGTIIVYFINKFVDTFSSCEFVYKTVYKINYYFSLTKYHKGRIVPGNLKLIPLKKGNLPVENCGKSIFVYRIYLNN